MTTATMFTILGVEIDEDQLKDIVMHGMSGGVSGFIYTRECVDKFNEHDDEIEEFLSDWHYDNMNEENYLRAMLDDRVEIQSIDALKNHMVWAYVELKAYDLLCEAGIEL